MLVAYEIVSDENVDDLVKSIVDMSNQEIDNQKFEKLPEISRLMVKSIRFFHKKKRGKNYIVVNVPIDFSERSFKILDGVFGLSKKLKKVFDSQGIKADVRLVKWR